MNIPNDHRCPYASSLTPKTSDDKKKYTFISPNLQNFSISRNIIYYILKNPNGSKGYQKLMKSCKFFYSKNPIIFVDAVAACSTDIFLSYSGKPYGISSFNKKKLKAKIWVLDTLNSYSDLPFRSIFQEIIHVRHLNIYCADLFYNIFLTLTNSNGLKNFLLFRSSVKYCDGINDVPKEKLLLDFPNLQFK